MKFKYIKSIVSAALFLSLTTGMTSCINDLDISPIDPQMTATFDQDMYFTKLYASLGPVSYTHLHRLLSSRPSPRKQ